VTFQDCKNSGDICVDNSGQALGGFVGNVLGSSIVITNGLYTGEITCSGGYAGGFVGNTNGKTGTTTVRLTNSTFSGKIHGKQRNFGGLIGSTQNSTDVDILNCISSGTIESSYSTSANGSAVYLGGMIGSIKTGSVIDIQSSAVTGTVKISDTFTGSVVGGIGNVDKGTVTMNKVLVSGNIKASQQVAGFIGQIATSGNASITMTDCHFSGSVEAFAPGGHLNAGILVGNASGYLENGTHRAPSIKVAEAAKVIENSQRDLNIAFVNELAKIFQLIGIDTHDVLEAAGTKWNFLKFKPGLVGGHCIGVDPYYLTHKAQSLGYLPEVILAGRRINDGMGKYIAAEVVKLLIRKELKIMHARVLQLGITFKENCPDIRNSHAVDVVDGLREFGCEVDIYDPWADPEDVKKEYNLTSFRDLKDLPGNYNAVVLAVAHKEFLEIDLCSLMDENAVVFDIKGILPRNMVDGRL
jgi:hypothetical protein